MGLCAILAGGDIAGGSRVVVRLTTCTRPPRTSYGSPPPRMGGRARPRFPRDPPPLRPHGYQRQGIGERGQDTAGHRNSGRRHRGRQGRAWRLRVLHLSRERWRASRHHLQLPLWVRAFRGSRVPAGAVAIMALGREQGQADTAAERPPRRALARLASQRGVGVVLGARVGHYSVAKS